MAKGLRGTGVVLAVALAALPCAVFAQLYRCVGADGKRYYGQTVPSQCAGQPVEQLNPQGMVIRRLDPRQASAPFAQPPSDDADRRRQEAVRRDQLRRDYALLATYSNEAEIEAARQRALRELDATPLDPDARRNRISAIHAKFDADLQRFRELAAAPPRTLPEVHVITPPPSVRDWERDEREARQRAERDRLELERMERPSDVRRPVSDPHPHPARTKPVPRARVQDPWRVDREPAREYPAWDPDSVRHERRPPAPPTPGLRSPDRPATGGPRLGYEEDRRSGPSRHPERHRGEDD